MCIRKGAVESAKNIWSKDPSKRSFVTAVVSQNMTVLMLYQLMTTRRRLLQKLKSPHGVYIGARAMCRLSLACRHCGHHITDEIVQACVLCSSPPVGIDR